MKSVYIHIPFCSSICSYCDFCKMLYQSNWAKKYLSILDLEIKKYYDGEVIKSIYIGGGTPSVLNTEELEYLFETIRVFKLKKNYEFTFELNVNDITEELLIFLKNNNVNRLSIGIQSFNKYKLKYLNRKHEKNDIINSINLVKKHFSNYNVDFMYATPIEEYKMFKRDLKQILKLGSPHISTYSLIIEENTVLKVKNTEPISEEEDYKMYKYICKKLKRKGYNHYEVSNFAFSGYESMHNLTYWNNDEYYGFGLGAHGFANKLRYENTRSLNDYLKGEFRKEELFVSKREDMENEVILGLRKLKGINIKHFFDKYQVNIQDEFNITSLMREKMLILKDNYLYIPENKIYIMNEIINKMIKQ